MQPYLTHMRISNSCYFNSEVNILNDRFTNIRIKDIHEFVTYYDLINYEFIRNYLPIILFSYYNSKS